MKVLVLFFLLILTKFSCFSQNIIESLQLKEDSIKKYYYGESTPTDTIVDLKNGYYEAFSIYGDDKKDIIRQAALFFNKDGSKTLGISTTEYDFQCYNFETNFYNISKSKDKINLVSNEDIIPRLTIEELIADTIVYSILNKYLPEIQENYLGSTATIKKVLSEVYHVVYIMPQRGTSLIATLRTCDYIPTNAVSINPDDWSIIENCILSIKLKYDKTQKKFIK